MRTHFQKTFCVILAVAAVCATLSGSAFASEVEVKMLNKGTDGSPMEFEPAFVKIAPGDSVHFVAVDRNHAVQSLPGMIPDGATPFTGKMNEDLTVKFEKQGVYGYRCLPHYGTGMVGLVLVGKAKNEDAARKAANSGMPAFARNKLLKLFAQMDAKK